MSFEKYRRNCWISELRESLPARRIWAHSYFSIVTTAPKPSVAPIHSRMPLVLTPSKPQIWLDGNSAALASHSHLALT